MEEKVDLTEVINKSIENLKLSNVPNPIYGKKLFFFDECVGPKYERNQLLGYLGAFCSFTKLTSEIDICVIPFASWQRVLENECDEITKELISKLEVKDEQTGRTSNLIPNTFILPESFLFKYIEDNLLVDDDVKAKQFERIDFSLVNN
ncbi:MAG TPA: hypothetical protein VF181_11695 [Balneolaceae bacterium]